MLDVDGDGRLELVVSNGYRDADARVEIYDLDPETGDPAGTPRISIDQLDGERMFYASFAVGDLDGDGRPELIVAWKPERDVDNTTLGAGYFEKMMRIGDLDGDGRNELVISTRGSDSEGVDTTGVAHVYAYEVLPTGDVRRDTVIDFDNRFVESSWIAIGDADDDGRPDLVLATGLGDRTAPGVSWVLRLWRS